MARRKQQSLIKGTANHCWTEDNMSILLDTATIGLEDVVSSASSAAKHGYAKV